MIQFTNAHELRGEGKVIWNSVKGSTKMWFLYDVYLYYVFGKCELVCNMIRYAYIPQQFSH